MAVSALFSPLWYRVADLRPRLKPHAQIHRQVFRNDVWYVLQDHASGRIHRFSPEAYQIIGLMDGSRTLGEIWRLAADELGSDLPTQDEVIRLLARLHGSDVLATDVPPDVLEQTDRGAKQRRQKLLQHVRNPLAIRIPLFDPNRFLDRTAHFGTPLFGPVGLLLWGALVLTAAVLAVVHWDGLTDNVVDRVLSAENILLMIVIYPIVKGLHELGHGYAAKRWGAEVREIGVMLLVLMPVPYVDASASTAFRSKWQRAIVAAAGIVVELFLAALALFVWLEAESGMVRAVAFNVMVIAGVSTLLFNGNPLLRFDGYYVLSDLIEVPNLGNRANRYLIYLAQRYLLGAAGGESPVTAQGERGWFVVYGIAAFAYRMFIMTVIVAFVATQFFVVGILLAIWAIAQMLVWPVLKGGWFLLTNPLFDAVRVRAVAVASAAAGLLVWAVLAVPLPHATISQGVVWTPERSLVHAETEGEIAEVLVPAGHPVAAGEPLLRLADPTLAARLAYLRAVEAEIRLQLAALETTDLVEAAIRREELAYAVTERQRAEERAAGLTVRAPTSGTFVVPAAEDLPGVWVRKGELLAHVVSNSDPIVRVVIRQAEVDLVRAHLTRAHLRFADDLGTVVTATSVKETPAVTRELPSLVLSTRGGGLIALDPEAAGGTQALERLYVIDLQPDAPLPHDRVGGRVHVRFDHGREPLYGQLYRALREVFLERFAA
ncbi:MAG: site-2 protease family protein [Alphaproteobacteria bacterium]